MMRLASGKLKYGASLMHSVSQKQLCLSNLFDTDSFFQPGFSSVWHVVRIICNSFCQGRNLTYNIVGNWSTRDVPSITKSRLFSATYVEQFVWSDCCFRSLLLLQGALPWSLFKLRLYSHITLCPAPWHHHPHDMPLEHELLEGENYVSWLSLCSQWLPGYLNMKQCHGPLVTRGAHYVHPMLHFTVLPSFGKENGTRGVHCWQEDSSFKPELLLGMKPKARTTGVSRDCPRYTGMYGHPDYRA